MSVSAAGQRPENPAINDLLKDYPVVVEIPVAWGEMDSFQHLNNVVYFRYFESARIAYSDRVGLQEYKARTGVGPILASTSCRYKIPLIYPDTVSVGARVVSMEGDRFTMNYAIVSHHHRKVAAEGDGVIVMYDYHEGKKTAMPDEIRDRILALERHPLPLHR